MKTMTLKYILPFATLWLIKAIPLNQQTYCNAKKKKQKKTENFVVLFTYYFDIWGVTYFGHFGF